MLVTNGFAHSSILSGPPSRVKVKMSSMDSGSSSRTMVGGDRRGKLVALEDSCIVGTSPTVTSTTSIGTNISTTMSHRGEDNAMLSTVRSTTPQVQRLVERRQTRWPVAASANGGVGGPRRRDIANDETTTCPVSAFTIVASKGELARNSSRCEAPASSGGVVVKRRTSTRTATNGDVGVVLLRDATKKQHKDPRRFSKSIGIPKSASVPANLQAGLRSSQKTLTRVHHEDGILKRSSAFLASLATSRRINEKKHLEGSNGGIESLRATGYELRESSVGPRHPSLRSYLSILTGGQDDLFALKRVSSVQTLPISGFKKKNVTGVRKSVSFSSDTSFEEKRSPLRKSAVHEVKVYRKGVLQDSHQRSSSIASKVPPSLESPSEGPTALLRAAREADDARLKEMLVTRPRKLGQKGMDVNLTDSSGRTAISYMAGNGTAAMLELALSLEGADPNLPDNEGNTPLHFAAQAGQTECLNILLQRCPDIEVDARNSLGFTPLMKAALQGRTKCAKILLFAGANPTLRDHGRGLRAEQWARFCGRYVCAEVIERFARHRLLERTTSCRWGSEPELAAKVLQGKVTPIPVAPLPAPSSGLKSRIRKVFRTTSGPDRSFSLVSQLTTAALCASSPALPKPGDVPPVVKSLLRPLSVPQLRVTLVSPQDFLEKTSMDKYACSFTEKIENTIAKPPRTKKKSK